MAKLQGTKAASGVQLGFYHLDLASGNQYVNLKTNLSVGSNVMAMIETIGLTYATDDPIRSAWCFYSSNPITNTGVTDCYTGGVAMAPYASSDSYVCLKIQIGVNRLGLTFNAYTVNPTGNNTTISITASTTSASSANYY